MTDVEKEWITSATSVGALFGAVGGGLIVDRIGRKWVLAVGDVFFVLGAVLVASSYHLEQIVRRSFYLTWVRSVLITLLLCGVQIIGR
jgi:SP family myo-inositol transporter-like MFS transporter 13